MLLTKVILKDYGVYQGKNEFDFSCTQEKPIILIGGSNGAGKTTLFESIMLGLYGMSILGKRITRKTYEKFLAKKIHRYQGKPVAADHASIIIQFQFFHEGKITEYKVDRTWHNNNGKILEKLTILQRNDGGEFTPLDSIEESYWQSFIEDLIPRGIARLFFFDGEKIVQIAEEGNEDIAIKSSFNSLLGLELVEQLRSDLQINLMRNLSGNEKQLEQEFAKYSAEEKETDEKVEQLQEKRIHIETEMDDILREIGELEGKVSKIGGDFALKRDELKSRKAVRHLQIENISKRIQELCAGALPFSLIPKELEEVKEQLKKDEEIRKKKYEKEILESHFHELESGLKDNNFWNEFNFDNTTKDKVQQKLLSILNFNLKQNSDQNQKELFHLSQIQSNKILDIINEANGSILDKLEKETQKYNEINEQLQQIDTSLINAPSDDEIGPLVSQLNEKHSEAGRLQAEIDHLDQKITSHHSLKKLLRVKIRDAIAQRYKNKKTHIKADLTEKVQNVLEKYSEKLKTTKLQLLEQYTLEAIQTLMHKKNFIDKVSIDKDSFEITLYRKDEEPIPKDLLSKGEQQMFATAILWALAKTSGKPLPFMIDTPLARLDIEHRTNLVEKFFPLASHQVLIFSTNSEIDAENYAKLHPYISRSYSMKFVPEEGKTVLNSGYFWNEKGEKIAAVQ